MVTCATQAGQKAKKPFRFAALPSQQDTKEACSLCLPAVGNLEGDAHTHTHKEVAYIYIYIHTHINMCMYIYIYKSNYVLLLRLLMSTHFLVLTLFFTKSGFDNIGLNQPEHESIRIALYTSAAGPTVRLWQISAPTSLETPPKV